MTENEQEYYETVSGKFAAYELLLAHLFRVVSVQIGETAACSLREDLVRQLNCYTTDQELPGTARIEMQKTVADLMEKVANELGS